MNNDGSMKILSPTGILGYGFPESSFNAGLEMNPDFIAVDAGSTDPGPYYLGSGKSFTDPIGVKRDLRYILLAAMKKNIPVFIGSCGGAGAKPHLEWTEEILNQIAEEENLSFKLGLIYADIEKETVKKAIKNGAISPLSSLPQLTEKDVDDSGNIVAQMGIEPIVNAIKQDCQVILTGRAYDPSVFAALPIYKGFDPGLAIHLGKILECAAIAADPGSGADCVMGILKKDSFELLALSRERKFTRYSTAAHSLYEKSDPYHLPGPGGILDLSEVEFTELPDGKVKVSGSKFVETNPYCVKLEATRAVGYRTVSIAGVRDPVMIKNIDEIIESVKSHVNEILKNENIDGSIYFHIYGRNGVMGNLDPEPNIIPKEIGIVIEAIGASQKEADTVCGVTRSTLLHYGYPGRIATAGNLAFPFSPSDLKTGEVFEFSIYHLMEVENQEIFNIITKNIGAT